MQIKTKTKTYIKFKHPLVFKLNGGIMNSYVVNSELVMLPNHPSYAIVIQNLDNLAHKTKQRLIKYCKQEQAAGFLIRLGNRLESIDFFYYQNLRADDLHFNLITLNGREFLIGYDPRFLEALKKGGEAR